MKKISLKKIATVQSGAGFPIKFQGKSDGDFPFAKVGEISRVARQGDLFINNASNWITESISFELKAKIFPKGTIVFAKIGEAIKQNFRAITDRPMLFDNNVMGITPNIAEVNIKYLFFFLKTVDFYQLASKTTLPSIRKSTIESLKIPLPPIAEQKRIAAILDKADAVRRKRREAIRLTEELLRSVFLDMFGNSVTDPYLVDLPRGWTQCRAESLKAKQKWSCVGGPFGSNLTTKDYVKPPGIPVIRGSNMSAKSLFISEYDFVYVSEEKANQLKQNLAYPGDILFTQRGTLGQVCLIPEKTRFPVYLMSQSQMKLKPDESLVDPIWMVSYFQSPIAQRIIQQRMQATGVPHLSLGILKDFPINLPPLDKQKAYREFRISLLASQEKQIRNLQESEDLFDSLLQRAFTGNL